MFGRADRGQQVGPGEGLLEQAHLELDGQSAAHGVVNARNGHVARLHCPGQGLDEATAESLLAYRPLDPNDLAQQFVAWYLSGPDDVGIHTSSVLWRIARGASWQEAVEAVQQARPDAAGNGWVMRCWPVALAHWDDLDALLADSRLQSQVTHPHIVLSAKGASRRFTEEAGLYDGMTVALRYAFIVSETLDAPAATAALRNPGIDFFAFLRRLVATGSRSHYRGH